jgi:hypothetical protein
MTNENRHFVRQVKQWNAQDNSFGLKLDQQNLFNLETL